MRAANEPHFRPSVGISGAYYGMRPPCRLQWMGCKEGDVHYRTRSTRGAGSEGTPQAEDEEFKRLVERFQGSL